MLIKKFAVLIGTFIVIMALSIMISFAVESEITLKLAHHHNVGGYADNLANNFKELVEKKSNGSVKIEIYPGGQLGQETEAAEGVLLGTIDISIISTVMYDNMVEGTAIYALPLFINWKSNEQIYKVFNDSEISNELNNRMQKKGGKILGTFSTGYRNMLFKDKDIKTFDEFKGLKIRSPESQLFVGMFNAINAKPTTITWGEVYTAVKTGVAVGLECSPGSIKDMNFYEVTKYCLLTHHMTGTMSLVINNNSFNRLPDTIKEIFIEAGKETTNAITKQNMDNELEVIEWLKEKGMIFSELEENERIKFSKALDPVVAQWADSRNAVGMVEELKKLTK